MAGFAGDIDLGISRGVCAFDQIIVLAHVGRVAVGTHEIPRLIDAGPEERIAIGEFPVRIQAEPVLACARARAAVPSYPEPLQASPGQFNEVLLKRRNSESKFYLVVVHRAVRSGGMHHETAAPAKEPGSHSVELERDAAEIAKNAAIARGLHRKLMMRSLPTVELAPMAPSAGSGTDKGGVRMVRAGGRFDL